ncbi:hypothetical protein FBUS_02439 [Fasciolopsis buskii]|uniref:Uncharacterized protein n=1 Tax=Fasciolopsis buskii TaxID=27845 RepID=A0A8E0VLL6_9TREM|nr:hypothetical protein FBUS_02439 [Fasciolopsis buski]
MTLILLSNLLIHFTHKIHAQTTDAPSKSGMSPVLQGILMGVGLFIGLLALILTLICCCCRPESASRSLVLLKKNKTKPSGSNDAPNVSGSGATGVDCVMPAGPPPTSIPNEVPKSINQEGINWYATSGQSLPAYAKPVGSRTQ